MQSSAIRDPSVVTPDTYRPKGDTGYSPSVEEGRIIADVKNRFLAQQFENYELHALWYQVSLFKHGLQYVMWSYDGGQPTFTQDSPDGHVRAVYNIMQSVQKQTESYFLESPPRYTTMAITEDGEDIEKSKASEQVLKHFESTFNVAQLRSSSANWLTTIGNCVLYCGWDPMAGPMVDYGMGQKVPRGDWAPEVVPSYQIVVDPNAKEPSGPSGPMWVGRRRIVGMDWVWDHYPDKARHVQDSEQISADSMASYELQWQNLTSRHGFSTRDFQMMQEGRKSVLLLELWEKPSRHHPRGRYLISTGDGVLLHAGINPYENEIPFAFIPFIRVEGAFWGRSTLMDLIFIQTEINRRESQKSEHCNYFGSPTLCHYEGDGIDSDNVTNIIGQILKLNSSGYPAQPFYLRPPEMSRTVSEMVPEAMQFVDFISGNFGPSRGQNSAKVTSGVQQMMLEEADARNMKPYLADWEAGWQRFYKLALLNFQKFAKVPHQMKVLGHSGQHRLRYLQGSDISDTTDVEIVPGSSQPKSTTAVFTQMLTLLQAGAINMLDPSDNQKFWEALDMGDMVRIKAEKKLDQEKALRNIDRIRSGQSAMYDVVGDNADVHLAAVSAFMKTAEFENAPNPVKFMALMYRQMIIAPLQQRLNMPVVPEGFPLFGPEGGGQAAPSRQAPPQQVNQTQGPPAEGA